MTPTERSDRRRRQAPRVPISLGLLILGSVALVAGAARTGSQPQGAPEQIEEVRTALQQMVETRRVLSAEKRDWAIGREALQDRIDLVQAELEELRAGIEDARASIGEAEGKRDELQDESTRLDAAVAGLGSTVAGLEERTRALLVTLPDPLRDRVRPISQGLPADPEDSRLGLSERFLTVVGILNEVNKFHREVSVTSEVRALEDGTSAEVSVLYLGTSNAFFVNGDGSVAGIGHSTPEGWSWQRADASAPEIAEAIAIFQNEAVASFVGLPITIE
jgi:hypothetical protein